MVNGAFYPTAHPSLASHLCIPTGTHHVPLSEGAPNTPSSGSYCSLILRPYNYFDVDPATDLAETMVSQAEGLGGEEKGRSEGEGDGEGRGSCALTCGLPVLSQARALPHPTKPDEVILGPV